jgi:hypothetical protein
MKGLIFGVHLLCCRRQRDVICVCACVSFLHGTIFILFCVHFFIHVSTDSTFFLYFPSPGLAVFLCICFLDVSFNSLVCPRCSPVCTEFDFCIFFWQVQDWSHPASWIKQQWFWLVFRRCLVQLWARPLVTLTDVFHGFTHSLQASARRPLDHRCFLSHPFQFIAQYLYHLTVHNLCYWHHH